jgi:hypothetical protein
MRTAMVMVCRSCRGLIEPRGEIWRAVGDQRTTCPTSRTGFHEPEIAERSERSHGD